MSVQGDSLSSVSQPFFVMPGWRIVSYDAMSGRTYEQGWARLRHQSLGRVVVYALGTNNLALSTPRRFAAHLRRVLAHIGPDRCLVVPDLYAHGAQRAWNRAIGALAVQVGPARMQVADWVDAVHRGRAPLADGVHPADERGWRARARVVMRAVRACVASDTTVS